jgi:hypothetical protein
MTTPKKANQQSLHYFVSAMLCADRFAPWLRQDRNKELGDLDFVN